MEVDNFFESVPPDEPQQVNILVQEETNITKQDATVLLDYTLWEALAYELALDRAPLHYIAHKFNISVEDVNQLTQDRYFSKLLGEKKNEVRMLGTDAEIAVTFRTIVAEALPDFVKRLKNSDTSAREYHGMMKTAIGLAKLEQVDEDGEIVTGVAGTEVVININGIPGLEHLDARVINKNSAEDAEVVEVEDTEQIACEPVSEPVVQNEVKVESTDTLWGDF